MKTSKLHVSTFPASSAALHTTFVVISEAKTLPDEGTQVISGETSTLSVADTAVKVTVLEPLDKVCTGQLRTGFT